MSRAFVRKIGVWLGLVSHLFTLWRSGQVRFRLETFGAYYPALPYRARWWQVNPRSMVLLLRRTGTYAHWLDEMNALRVGGADAWWESERGV